MADQQNENVPAEEALEAEPQASVEDLEAATEAAAAEPEPTATEPEPAKAPPPPPRPARSPEERQAERDAARRAKAAQRRRRRAKERADRAARPTTTPSAAAEVPAVEAATTGRPKVRLGRVVSDKADKTITVRIDMARRHRRYEKIVRSTSTLHAHDEGNEAHEGDLVRVVESRPLSATKRWRLVEVLERAR